jgi:exodeoxyribonuclease-5
VIVGTHHRRRELNNAMKLAAGFTPPLPTGRGEKLIGLKNEHELGLFNGQFLELRNVGEVTSLSFAAEIVTEDGDRLGRQLLYRGHFDDHTDFDKDRAVRDTWERRDATSAKSTGAGRSPVTKARGPASAMSSSMTAASVTG